MYFEVGGSTFLQNLVIFRRLPYSDLSDAVRKTDFAHSYTVKGVKIDIPQSKVTPYFRAFEKPILILQSDRRESDG